jgi:hypothetical protein
MASSLCTQAGRSKKPCPWWLRAIFRVMFGFLCFFLAVAISFYGTIGGLSGGFSLPLTLAIPCFMWVKIKKPEVYSLMRWLNWGLGLLGMALSTSSRFPTIFPMFREQNYFLLPYKKISHNRFPYLSLYQLNIIFLLLFYSFSLFPTFSLFPISINYTSFILK